MQIVILSQYYDPEPVPKSGDLARALRDAGHDVLVVTGFPNYPSGKLYEGFHLGLIRTEVRDGIPVVRTFEYPYHGTNVLGRVANYGSFMLSAPLAALRLGRRDVMYVWHPPLTVGVAAWAISRLRGVPFVYDVQDIWPETALLSGMLRPGLVVRLLSALERFVYRRASHILVVTEGARQNLIGKGVPPDRVTVMPHWIDEESFAHVPTAEKVRLRSELGWNSDFVALFAGNLGLVQGLDTIIFALRNLPREERIRVVFVGDGADKNRLVELTRSEGVSDRVQFIERQPMERMPTFMAAADALLVHLRKSELSRYVIPTKTFAYLASGRPIIMAMEGAAADLVGAADAGVVIPPDDPAAFRTALTRLARTSPSERQAFGTRGRNFLRANFSKSRVMARYQELLLRVARQS